MEDLHRLQQAKWVCSSLQRTSQHMGFCKNLISYDPALPVVDGAGSMEVKEVVMRQDNAASTMFYYHLSGLGMEAWDYRHPEDADDCVKSIWRMVCFTYFPRASIGCQEGSFTDYLRPCQSSCMNYIRSCEVECCDESVQCVFQHKKAISTTEVVTTQGYLPHDGPSSLCTGGAHRSAKPFGAVFWAVIAVIMAMALQGCNYDIPVHQVGNWRGKPDYLIQHEFVAPGESAKTASLNSCSIPHLSQEQQCSGRGTCRLWDPKDVDNSLAFCECDTRWADPECRTRRKSQKVAYFLALFFGGLGLDQFYLGYTTAGLFKLFTFGGFGIVWIEDVVRIGSAPVYSANRYRTASDLWHTGFVLTATMAGIFVGFAIAYLVTILFRARKRREALLCQMQEDKRQWAATHPEWDESKEGSDKLVTGAGQFISYGSIGEAMPGTMGGMPPMGTMGAMPPMGTMGPMPMMGTMGPMQSMPGMNPFGSTIMKF
jgi:hypothetical protein